MVNFFQGKLSGLVELSNDDCALLKRATEHVVEVPAGRDIIRERTKSQCAHVILDGWAGRYEILRNGKRQFAAFLLPGDLCNASYPTIDTLDHGVSALTQVSVALVPAEAMLELKERPAVARALLYASLIDEAVLRAWIVSIGRREARDRVAHLMCELYVQLRHLGLTDGNSFKMPLTQEEAGDALGLTSVHVNRCLRRLREEGLLTSTRGLIIIHDLERLFRAVGFDPSYLQLASQSQTPQKAAAAVDRRSKEADALRST